MGRLVHYRHLIILNLISYKYLIAMCLVLLVLDLFPFCSNCITLVSSCSIMLSIPDCFNFEFYGKDFAFSWDKHCAHITKNIVSSTPSSSAAVELLVTNFCLSSNLTTSYVKLSTGPLKDKFIERCSNNMQCTMYWFQNL